MPAPYPNQKTLDLLWGIVCQVNGYACGPVKTSRKQEQVILRHVFWAIAKGQTTVSLKQLAIYSGVDNHTSVLHGLRRVKKAMEITNLGKYFEPAVVDLYVKALGEYLILEAKEDTIRPTFEVTTLDRKYPLTTGYL